MENLVNKKLFGDIYRSKRVLVTGHTGFKGSWLSLWLHNLGAFVGGYSLEPITKPAHFNILELDIDSNIGDINQYDKLFNYFTQFQPEIVFHLAAQPIVLDSYENPLYTFQTNSIGTANVLECSRKTPSVRAIVSITTDKVYENMEWMQGYRETDRLGGYDPYSASKTSAEIITSSYRRSFFNPDDYADKHNTLVATARAGNVIGGGDWSAHRLIPDIVKSIVNNKKLIIRNPQAIRPWQHVLEPLSGYLLLGQYLLEGKKEFADAWNFGPKEESCISVSQLIDIINDTWQIPHIEIIKNEQHEANFLKLDCSKAINYLKWEPILNIKETVLSTINWYKAYYTNRNINTESDLCKYISELKYI